MENSVYGTFLQELYVEARRNTGWVKFLGILLVIFGVITAIVLIGFLFIWMGMILVRAANAIEREGVNGLEEFAERIGLYFKINGIILIVGLVIEAILWAIILSGAFPMLGPSKLFT